RYFLDGPSALAAAPEFAPDVCVLDIRMPRMDGYELAGRLRAALGGARPLLVAFTGEAGSGDEPRAAQAGFHLRFAKPANPLALVRAVCAAAGRELAVHVVGPAPDGKWVAPGRRPAVVPSASTRRSRPLTEVGGDTDAFEVVPVR